MRAPWEPRAATLRGTLLQTACFDVPTAFLLAAGVQAGGSLLGGIQQKQAADYNSAVAGRAATEAESDAAAAAQQDKQIWARRIGQQTADFGASGVDPGSGSPVNVIADTAQQGSLEERLTRYRGAVQAGALRQQGVFDKIQGNQALTRGFINAGVSALIGYAYYSKIDVPGGGTPKAPSWNAPLRALSNGYTPGAL